MKLVSSVHFLFSDAQIKNIKRIDGKMFQYNRLYIKQIIHSFILWIGL